MAPGLSSFFETNPGVYHIESAILSSFIVTSLMYTYIAGLDWNSLFQETEEIYFIES